MRILEAIKTARSDKRLACAIAQLCPSIKPHLMRMLLYVLGGIVALVALAGVIVGLLPSQRSATHTVAIAAPPARILAVLNDLARQPEWRPDVATVVVHSPTAWTEVLKAGPRIKFERPDVWSDNTLTCSVRGDGFTGSWQARLQPSGGTTVVTLTETIAYQTLVAKLFGYTLARVETLTQTYGSQLKAAAERTK